MTNYEYLKDSGQLSEFLEWMNDDLEDATWFPGYCPFCGRRLTKEE